MRVAYFTPKHLKTATDPEERFTGSYVRFDYRFPSVLPEPKQIGDRVFAAGQNHHISCARFFRSPRVIDNYTCHILQSGKICEVGKIRQPDHTHAETIFAVERRPHRLAFER